MMHIIKRLFAIILVMILGVSLLTSCGGNESEGSGSESENWKIGIVTGTVAQNEEEYRAAQDVKKKLGENHVILQTYPDKFMDEQETVIANIVGIASDPDVKALVICQAVPGTSAAIDKIKETRDDLLIIVGTPGEDPGMVSERADICLQVDDLGMGSAVIEQAKKQGAETFVHYTFPRHMSYAILATRRDLFEENCERLGLKFVDATAPDPTGDAGISGSQQFILEDVPKKVAEYGENTAFFSTNCAMQTPLIKSVYDEHAIYPQPCCPSPYHGFPSALEVNIPDENKGDAVYLVKELRRILAEKDMTGRMSTWKVPINMMFIEAGADYAAKWINGDFEEKLNIAALEESCKDYAKRFADDISLTITPYSEEDKNSEEDKTYDNFLLILSDFIDL